MPKISALSSQASSLNSTMEFPGNQGSTTVRITAQQIVAGSFSTATGDLVYASSASSVSRLAIGSSGEVLQSTGGIPAWVNKTDGDPSTGHISTAGTSGQILETTGGAATWVNITGTAQPGTPAEGDRFFRTDLGLWTYYDGTRWLSANEYSLSDPVVVHTGGSTITRIAGAVRTDYEPFYTRYEFNTFAASTNNASTHWNVQIHSASENLSSIVLLSSFNTGSDTVATYTRHAADIDTTVASGNDYLVSIKYISVNTPGNLTAFGEVFYRLIIT